MAFVLNQFGPIGGQSRGRRSVPPGAATAAPIAFWSYFHAADNLATIVTDAYFNEVRNLLSPGDAILVSVNGASVSIVTVNAVPAIGADVSIQTADINSA